MIQAVWFQFSCTLAQFPFDIEILDLLVLLVKHTSVALQDSTPLILLRKNHDCMHPLEQYNRSLLSQEKSLSSIHEEMVAS